MAQERNVDFMEVPNTFQLFIDKVSVLDRKVLVEKVKRPDFELEFENELALFERAFGGEDGIFGNGHVLTFAELMERIAEKPKVLCEKNLLLVGNRIAIRKRKKELFEKILRNVKTTPSKFDDLVIDITTFEGVDFNRPCTIEEKIEIGKEFDYYVYQECIDEIECEIKTKDDDGAEMSRMNYGQKDEITESITKHFTENQTVRLPELYIELTYEKIDSLLFNSVKRKRRVLVEKMGYPTFIEYARYGDFWKTMNDSNYNWIERSELKRDYRQLKDELLQQELKEIQSDLHRMLNNEV